MPPTLATMVTICTYGTWLRGDARGWVDDGITYPPDPVLEQMDFQRLKHPPYKFPRNIRLEVGDAIGRSLIDRLGLHIYAMCLQSWHGHIVIGDTPHALPAIVKCAKDAARWHLRIGRPIWAVGYDKRFCFDRASVRARVRYGSDQRCAEPTQRSSHPEQRIVRPDHRCFDPEQRSSYPDKRSSHRDQRCPAPKQRSFAPEQRSSVPEQRPSPAR